MMWTSLRLVLALFVLSLADNSLRAESYSAYQEPWQARWRAEDRRAEEQNRLRLARWREEDRRAEEQNRLRLARWREEDRRAEEQKRLRLAKRQAEARRAEEQKRIRLAKWQAQNRSGQGVVYAGSSQGAYRNYAPSFYAQGATQTMSVHSTSSVTRVSSASPTSVNAVPWRHAEEGGGRITREWHGFAIPSWVVRFKVVEDPKRKIRGYARLNQYVLLTDPDRKGGERVNQYPRPPRPAAPPKPKPSGPRKPSEIKTKSKLLPAPSMRK